MLLKPQDILVLLKLVALDNKSWSYASLSLQLGISSSQVHSAIKRSLVAALAIHQYENIVPNIRNLQEFLVYGLKYVFVPEHGEMVRGMPTGYAAPPLEGLIISSNEPPPVWPDSDGTMRGIAFSPLYKSVPEAARMDPKLYELLVLVDGIRAGRARERDIASKELSVRLQRCV